MLERRKGRMAERMVKKTKAGIKACDHVSTPATGKEEVKRGRHLHSLKGG